MARKPSPGPVQADLSLEKMKQAIPRLKKRIAEVEAFEPDAVPPDDPEAAVRPLKDSIQDALVRTYGNDTVEYWRYRPASDFSWPLNMFQETPIHEIRAALKQAKQRSLDLLGSAVRSLEEQIEELEGRPFDANVAPARPKMDERNRKVFIVHGRDDGPKEALARFLERLEFEPIILHEQPNRGQTIIEKFESNADVGFAVIVLTPDDEGGLRGEKVGLRPRQNVILELGYFVGRLGRDRVCALRSGDMELPSDILGVLWTEFDAQGAWKAGLGKELQAAGYDFDWNKVMGS